MEIPIVVEPLAENGFRAISGAPLALESHAATRDEAVRRLQELIDARIRAGAEFISLNVGQSQHPLAPFAGILKNDPLLQPWNDAMAEYRALPGNERSE